MPIHQPEQHEASREQTGQEAVRARHANRLARETSPYLLQHAQNPVDWWPWGREAFEEARRRGVPIFLSVGYSTCYWCHVMERESFENEQIAALMNERFVCIKVDREERPDVDNLYMTATQVFSGRGGWPMSVFVEPEKLRPFWCGTYFPAEPRPGMNIAAFPQVLEGISGAWSNQRSAVLEQAESLAGAVRENLAGAASPVPVGHRDVERAADRLLRAFDQVHGGFGSAPKFPQTVYADFLLDAREHAEDKPTRDAIDRAVRASLDAMATGGIRDHVGGGFHRYAVDATWTVPHFEKMLYDQALLARLYTRAGAVYDDAEYRRVVRETLEFVLREMTGEGGGFYSAQDAEVDGREGLNYLWTPTQIAEALDPGDAEFAAEVYGLTKGPNFRDPHHPDGEASNVLRLEGRPAELAGRFSLSRDEFLMKLAGINRKLYGARKARTQPGLDDKVIAEWNGLAIAAFAEAAVLFKDKRYFDAAERGAGFVLGSMTGPDGRLRRSWRAGVANAPGVLEDSGAMILGLVALHRAALSRTGAPRTPTPYLASAVRVYELAVEDFRAEDMGYHDTRADREDLFVRSRTTYDGATPCGSSMMLHALLDLADATGEPSYIDRAVSLLRAVSNAVSRDPVATVNSTRGLLRLLRTDRSRQDPETFAPLDLATDQSAPEPCPEAPAVTPVEIYAETDRLRVSPGRPAELALLVRIADGYHLTGADPRPSDPTLGLAPFRVGVVGGEGIACFADYPDGSEHGLAGDTFLAYTGQFELRVAVEQTGELLGRPRLAVTYQACTQTECLMPRTVELDVAIDAA
ncbi:MAG: DUF255 domain-containing protein [Phycisphaerales bacterium]|nr:DUF255 domain-containing protein [Phycisphaerales bacterium]